MILSIAIQVVFNILNAYIDAYRILKNKTIAHGINLGCYAVVVGIEVYFLKMVWWMVVIFCIQAFLNRQNTFDIPLNLRRKLKFDYMSQDKPPKAWWDRQEYRIFGNNGRLIALTYIGLWVVSLTIIFIIFTQ